MFQVQRVDLAHERQIGRADRLGQVVDRAPTDVQQPGLARDGKLVVSVNHGFALSNPALVSALSKKSFSSVNAPILACSGARFTGSGGAPEPKTSAARSSSRPFQSAIWFGLHLELFAQFSHGAVLSQGGHGHSGLERRIVRAPRAPRRCFLLHHQKLPSCQTAFGPALYPEFPLMALFKFVRPLLRSVANGDLWCDQRLLPKAGKFP